MNKTRGLLITFEGPEGGGKSTHAARLAARMQAAGHDVVRTREPGGTEVGDAIREILQYDRVREPIASEAEALLFAASRAQVVRTVIMPAMERGAHVICDRFADSTTVYQGYGRGLGLERMEALNGIATGGVVPDLTLLLDVDVGLGFERLSRREAGHDRMERERREFHERVRQGYLDLAGRHPDRFRVIDTNRAEDAVAEEIWKHVTAALEKRR